MVIDTIRLVTLNTRSSVVVCLIFSSLVLFRICLNNLLYCRIGWCGMQVPPKIWEQWKTKYNCASPSDPHRRSPGILCIPGYGFDKEGWGNAIKIKILSHCQPLSNIKKNWTLKVLGLETEAKAAKVCCEAETWPLHTILVGKCLQVQKIQQQWGASAIIDWPQNVHRCI